MFNLSLPIFINALDIIKLLHKTILIICASNENQYPVILSSQIGFCKLLPFIISFVSNWCQNYLCKRVADLRTYHMLQRSRFICIRTGGPTGAARESSSANPFGRGARKGSDFLPSKLVLIKCSSRKGEETPTQTDGWRDLVRGEANVKTASLVQGVAYRTFLSSHIRTYYLQSSTTHASLLDKNGCLLSVIE